MAFIAAHYTPKIGVAEATGSLDGAGTPLNAMRLLLTVLENAEIDRKQE